MVVEEEVGSCTRIGCVKVGKISRKYGGGGGGGGERKKKGKVAKVYREGEFEISEKNVTGWVLYFIVADRLKKG
ncbi:hypothetical protein Hanom_Chr01g00080131 [Helianthus anomalus]